MAIWMFIDSFVNHLQVIIPISCNLIKNVISLMNYKITMY